MNATSIGSFTPDPRVPDGSADPVFGPVQQGWVHGMWAIRNPALGVAHLTDGSRVVTPQGDGILSGSRGFLRRRSSDRHVDLDGHRFTLHHTSPWNAQFRRDGQAIGALRRRRIGSISRGGRITTYQVTWWAEPSDVTAAAVAHLLASKYRVGAPGIVANACAAVTQPRRAFG